MENYRKGKNNEEPLERNKIPIENLPENFLWMQVRGGSKIRNLLTHALNEFPNIKHVVWTGFGPSVGKCITCAEIMKRECNNSLHQITRLCYRSVDEYWDPLLPELDQLVVKRKLPMIHIYLSETPIDTEELGYQAPGVYIPQKSKNSSSFKSIKPNDKKFKNSTPKRQESRQNNSSNLTAGSNTVNGINDR
ncbi:ribonuclease P protein subunit p25-like protein [Leptinotarsa decemlineata]|uniref:ribonuclease P protein subunit p25-like protein n=1 Tax=Leptinotarsa decemlineata TaxID=7539 RepID=UPI003D3078CA